MYNYSRPEPDQTELSRKVRGERTECERLALQEKAAAERIAATIKHALALAALLAAAACGSLDAERQPVVSVSEQPDAGSQCAITLCGVAHSGLCQSEYGDVVYNAGGSNAVPGEPSWCSTADLGSHWKTCCAVWCSPGDDSTFEYQCGTVAK